MIAWCLGGVGATTGLAYYVTATWPLHLSGKVVPAGEATTTQRLEAVDRLVLFPYLVVVSWLAVRASAGPAWGSFEERWFESSVVARWCLVLYVTKTFVDLFAQLATLGKPGAKRVEMIAHHAVSAFCIAHGLHAGVCHFFGCLAIVSEVSTLFLNGLMAVKLFTGEKTKLQRNLSVLNGLLLWLSYLVVRILLFPMWFWIFFSDVASHDVSSVSKVQLVLYPASTLTIFILSLYWFGLITSGLIKALLQPPPNKKKVA
ncbi:hypothetical protein CTAYLR_009870 [Chrysophaeum taylorii]|uniref:TLC domain-containing protein n=1 Tax=Chrysophaeum taylorii TaxID=2483200 RepID=A0AAD7U7P8_9STRA|nr:hypothetical protein CTAYLR_009870 [Chrysophaeum taylorii]